MKIYRIISTIGLVLLIVIIAILLLNKKEPLKPFDKISAQEYLAKAGNGYGFPVDFPVLDDTGGLGAGTKLTGFGGFTDKDRGFNIKEARANGKRPVILIHGNSQNVYSQLCGMIYMRDFLKKEGYNDAQIWAVSYLGKGNIYAETRFIENIDDVRLFIDTVIAYLKVKKVDIIGHSLGCSMTRSYICGLKKDGTFDKTLRREKNVGTVVLLAGANHGLGEKIFTGAFQSNSSWQRSCEKCEKSQSVRENIFYVALFIKKDFVEHLHEGFISRNRLDEGFRKEAKGPYTGDLDTAKARIFYNELPYDYPDIKDLFDSRFDGPHNFGGWAHWSIVKRQAVFDDFKKYLNK